MKKTMLGLVALLLTVQVYGVYYGAVFNGKIVKWIPEKGQIIKKGGTLVEFGTQTQKLKIKIKNLEIQTIEHELKDKKTDLKRSHKLITSQAKSVADHEDEVLCYEKCEDRLALLKAELKVLELHLKLHTAKAPFDCMITEVFLCAGSGVEVGQHVLAFEKTN